MKKINIIIILFFSIVGLAFAFAITNKKANSPGATEMKTENSEISNTKTPNGNSGKYIDYDRAVISNVAGQKVLFFHAPWCPQCRSIEKDILASEIPSGLTIIKVDYDSNQDLRQKYGVTLQTTFVKINDSGDSIDKYVAYDEPTFDAVKQNFLNR